MTDNSNDADQFDPIEFTGEKDEIIAHFQEVTSLDDIGQCLDILEAVNWNLDEAIQTYLTNSQSPMIIQNDPVDVAYDVANDLRNTEAIYPKSVKSTEIATTSTTKTDEDYAHDNESDNDEESFSSLLASSQNDLSAKRASLIPNDYDNDYEATDSFVSEFANRYGPLMPLFFIGSIDAAIRDALLCPARDRKLFGIYLHSDHTIYCNIFCSKVLCDETVVDFLSSNFLVWPWDLTLEKNEAKFYNYCTKNLGDIAVNALQNLKNKLPLFLVVTRVRASNEISAIIQGDSTKEQMLNDLMHSYEMFETQRFHDEQDEQQREERERIKYEQDVAYQVSLNEDKAKMQRQKEQDLKQEEDRLNEQLFEKETKEKFEQKKIEFQRELPSEPGKSVDKRLTSVIRLKLPNGEFVQRMFFAKHSLRNVVAFAGSLGYFVEDYKLLSSWPRRDLTLEETSKTLEELKLCPQETINIEER